MKTFHSRDRVIASGQPRTGAWAVIVGVTLWLMAADQAAGADLCLRFTTSKPGGVVVVALFDSASAWKRAAGPVRTASVPVSAGGAELRFGDLPVGGYGVMAYQDRNRDGKLNTLPVGLPTEPYGFSNDARGLFGPPAWSAAAFQLPADGCAAQVIALR